MSENDNYLKRKRTSKFIQEGRDIKCKYCDKTYLSAIARNNHIKTKHSDFINYPCRGRGRPRKDDKDVDSYYSYLSTFNNFFNNEERKRRTEESFDYFTSLKLTVSNLYKNFNSILTSINSEVDFSITLGKENSTDSHLLHYLEYTSSLTNEKYFSFISKFVLLLREYINIQNGTAFTQSNLSSNFIPEIVNEFLTDFIEENKMFDMDLNSLLDIIQHFCYWLYRNEYTTTKVALIS